MSKTTRGDIRVVGLKSQEMDFQLLRTIAKADAAAAVGQCFYAAKHIKEGCLADWVDQFDRLARESQRLAEERFERGHVVSARDFFLQASEYYRAAEYYCDPRSFDRRDLGCRAGDCFQKYVGLIGAPARFVEIPYEDGFLPAYFFSPDEDASPRKTLVGMSGFDGTSEELYCGLGRYALERNFNVLLFDGPGQTGSLRFNADLKFRPDYEVPLRAVLDYACSREDVDCEKVALAGMSYGGYFAARGAAYDQRIRALALDPPIVDLFRYNAGFVGGSETMGDFLNENDFVLEEIDKLPPGSIDLEFHWLIANYCFRFGRRSFGEVNEYLREFALSPAMLMQITCPTLLMLGAGEGDEPAEQAIEFCKYAGGPVGKRIFTDAEGAGSHCQLGNSRLAAGVMLDWFDDVFRGSYEHEVSSFDSSIKHGTS